MSASVDELIAGISELYDPTTDADTKISFLYDVNRLIDNELNKKALHGNKQFMRYREYGQMIDNKANNMLLILLRLKQAANSNFFSGVGVHKRTVSYFMIDLESYFYHATSIMALVARLTPYFYPTFGTHMPSKSFREQKKWFITNFEVDPTYTQILIQKTEWFHELRYHRVNLTHWSDLYIFWNSQAQRPYFGTYRNRAGFISNQDLLEYIKNSSGGLIEFLFSYNSHFSSLTRH